MQSGVRVRQSVWSYLGFKHLANGHSLDELRARRSAPPSTRRFTLDGSQQIEAEAGRLCQRVLDCVKTLIPSQTFQALVLGGGYGRGQGGVFNSGNGERLYNDIEFYVFLRGNRLWNERIYRPTLERLGERLSKEAGLHVEFKI